MTSRLEIPISISTRIPVAGRRTREPVTFGVPLPRGVAAGIENWCLEVADQSLPVQSRVLDRWPDGSVRWLLVDAQVDVPAERSATAMLRQTDQTVALRDAVRVVETAGGFTVSTGAADFAVRPGASFPFACSGALDVSGPELSLIDGEGRQYTVAIAGVQVLEPGPMRVRLEVDGKVSGDGPLSALDVRATVDVFSGSPVSRIAIRLRNPQAAAHPGGFWDLGGKGSLYIRQASLRTTLVGGSQPDVSCSPEPGTPASAVTMPFEIYQDSSGGDNWDSAAHLNRHHAIPVSFRGYRMRSGSTESFGLRATPIVMARAGARLVAASIEHFWQNFPKALEVSFSGEVAASLFPGQFSDIHELQGGEQKTHVCYLAFGPDPVADLPLEWTRSRLLCSVTPKWIMDSGVIPWLSEDDPGHRRLVWSALEGPDTFERKREVVDEYGWRHFGDVYGDHEAIKHTGPKPLTSHYNNQYDPLAGFLFQFFRSGDSRWFDMATELAGHVIDIDVYHTVQDKWSYNHGMFWHTYHYGEADTSTHRTHPLAGKGETHGGGPSPDHNYTTGLMLHYFLTGEPAARETVVDLAQFVIDADDGSRTVLRWLSRANTGYSSASGSYAYHGPGRGPANSLNALIDGHRLTGDARFLAKAEQLIARVVHPEEDISRHRLDEPEHKWFYLMFLQSLGKYVAYKAGRGELDSHYAYAKASLLHYARWMAEHEYPYLEKPERLTFPTETWAAHEARKSDIFYFAAMNTSGDERILFIQRGTQFFKNSIETLAAAPTRTLARPVIVLLSSGMLHPWHQGPSAKDFALPPAPAVTFAPHTTFVPQKQVAFRRAKLIAVSAGLLLLATAALATYLIWGS